MIPVADITPTIPRPLPDCELPSKDEITEEGFGYFRGTWYVGRVSVKAAAETVEKETRCLAWLDSLSSTHREFEVLAQSVEMSDLELVPGMLRERVLDASGREFLESIDDLETHWLDGLEVGVAGLVHALSAVRCVTAASCRAHCGASWSDCPVVFFAAASWRIPTLADLISEAGCGFDADRGMLKVYGPSVRDMNYLAGHILHERARFRAASPSARRGTCR